MHPISFLLHAQKNFDATELCFSGTLKLHCFIRASWKGTSNRSFTKPPLLLPQQGCCLFCKGVLLLPLTTGETSISKVNPGLEEAWRWSKKTKSKGADVGRRNRVGCTHLVRVSSAWKKNKKIKQLRRHLTDPEPASCRYGTNLWHQGKILVRDSAEKHQSPPTTTWKIQPLSFL